MSSYYMSHNSRPWLYFISEVVLLVFPSNSASGFTTNTSVNHSAHMCDPLLTSPSWFVTLFQLFNRNYPVMLCFLSVAGLFVTKSSRRCVSSTTTPQATQQYVPHFLFKRSRRTSGFLWYHGLLICVRPIRRNGRALGIIRETFVWGDSSSIPCSSQSLGFGRSIGNMVTRQHGQSVFLRSHLRKQSWWNTW